MGILGDTINEFKNAKTSEKVFIAGGAIAVVAIAIYVHKRGSSQTPATTTDQGTSPTGGGGGGIQTVPTGSQGQVPILPAGLCPITDASGSIVGYQPCTTTTPTPTPTPTGFLAPLIPSGQYKGPSYSNLQPGTSYIYNGTKYLLNTGAGGRLYGTNPQGQHVLLYGPPSSYVPAKQGGGPYGTRVLGHHGSRIAPVHQSRKQSTTAMRVYAMRTR